MTGSFVGHQRTIVQTHDFTKVALPAAFRCNVITLRGHRVQSATPPNEITTATTTSEEYTLTQQNSFGPKLAGTRQYEKARVAW
jgi:hypothetical protein